MFDGQYICLQSWVPVRAQPSSASEMVTSLLFGETCLAVGEVDDWLQVKTTRIDDARRIKSWMEVDNAAPKVKARRS